MPPVTVSNRERVFLCFDGVANTASVELHGVVVGEDILPFVPYRFDVTELVSPGRPGRLKVTLRDFGAIFGYSPGWETYGGLIRGVYLEVTDRIRIEGVHVVTRLSEDLLTAHCRVEVFLSNAGDSAVDVGLA